MRIITWNCKMAFRNKAHAVLALAPDVLVIPECESPERLAQSMAAQSSLFSGASLSLEPDRCYWIGASPKKGLAVFALGDYSLEFIPCDLSNGPIWCIPLRVLRSQFHLFDLLAVWSFYGRDPRNRGKNPMTHGLEDFAHLLLSPSLVVAGDFNSPVDFEEKGPGGFQATNRAFEERGLIEAYNAFTGDPLGQETQPTYYHCHAKESPFHLDHVYVPRAWTDGMSVEVGGYEPWVSQHKSDHTPIIVDISEETVTRRAREAVA